MHTVLAEPPAFGALIKAWRARRAVLHEHHAAVAVTQGLLQIVDEEERGHFREVLAQEIVELARPVPHPDVDAAATLVAKARQALAEEGLSVSVACFEPADRPVLTDPQGILEGMAISPGSTLYAPLQAPRRKRPPTSLRPRPSWRT